MTTALQLLVICLTQLIGNTRGYIPEGYIMKITPTCGADYSGDGHLDIVTDLDADAKAICKDENSVHFSTVDEVNFRLNFSYAPGGESCVMSQRENSRVYFVKIIISYGEPDNEVHQFSEEYTVTCSFDPKGTNDSASHIVGDTLIAAQEIQTNVGPESDADISLKVVDVLHNDLQASTVHLGRMIRLEASFTGSESGIRPVSCNAYDTLSNAYAFLRAGCGDGIVLQKDAGFEMTGTKAYSPYFKTFTINHDSVVKFACNFTLCSGSCAANSCNIHPHVTTLNPPPLRLIQRVKRGDEKLATSLIASTSSIRLTSAGSTSSVKMASARSSHAGVGTIERTNN